MTKKKVEKGSPLAIGIDPGKKGAIVVLFEDQFFYNNIPYGADERVDFRALVKLFKEYTYFQHSKTFKKVPIFLERAVPMAMGSKHAFNYGSDFCKIEIAIMISKLPVVYVEPSKWAKRMHEGISKDLKPKAKSIIAVERLCPELVSTIPRSPKSKVMHEGVVDALLIAKYGALVSK